MELSAGGSFRAKWTDAIQEEWIKNLLANRRDIVREQLDRTKELMTRAVPDCLVSGFESIVASLDLPDTGDNHVLAAAIHCGADAIVTFNLKDFPSEKLAPFDLEAQHPAAFINRRFGLDRAGVVIAARRCRARLKNPPISVEKYLRALEAQSLPQTVGQLRAYADVL